MDRVHRDGALSAVHDLPAPACAWPKSPGGRRVRATKRSSPNAWSRTSKRFARKASMPAGANGTLMSSSRTDALAPDRRNGRHRRRSNFAPRSCRAATRGAARRRPRLAAGRRRDTRMPHEAMALLEASANGQLAGVLRADPAAEGPVPLRRRTVTSFNFIRGAGQCRRDHRRAPRAGEQLPARSRLPRRAMIAERYFPGFAETHPMPLRSGRRRSRASGSAMRQRSRPTTIRSRMSLSLRRAGGASPCSRRRRKPDLYMGPQRSDACGRAGSAWCM